MSLLSQGTLELEAGRQLQEVIMELDIVDQLLICLVDQPRNVPMAMRALGYTQEQISVAWREARAARYTEPTGLGQDRLTPTGAARAKEVSS